ncbi:flippase [uncultured Alteromonas sp.]|jgi:O-antigen/teichoic acid export membrane protein|uniref:flippase n=1 Tax=uncultured Alteromonas sp. TaxID=179113 RepID=UPI0025D6F44F|nr:flippase [uncultured Alteromonas sp.]
MAGNGRVLKNLVMVFASEGVGGLLSFIIVLLAARLLGVEQFGVFSYILAITSVCQLVADFGLTNLIVREVAKDTSKAQYIMSNVLTLAWGLSAVILALVTLISLVSLTTAEQQSAAIIMGVAVLATYHSVVYSSVCRAFEQMSYNAISFVVHKVILLGLIYLFYHWSVFSSSLLAICTAYLVANLCQYAYFYLVVRARFIRFGFGRDFAFAWQLLKDAVPIGASMVIRRLTLQVDTLLLGVLATASAVGLFSAAYKVVQVVDMIPFAICLPLFPAMSRMASKEPDKLPAFFSLTLTGFLLVSIPLCGYVFVSAGNLIELFYGQTFVSAVPALRILAFAIIGLFVNMLLSYVFMALGKQRFYLLAAMSCLIVNALVDVLLIPRMGATGAAWGTLLGELSYFLLCIVFLSRVQLAYAWLTQLARPVLLCAAISWVAYQLPPQGVAEQILFSVVYVVSYVFGLFVLRVLKPAEVKRVIRLLTERSSAPPLADNSASGS